MTQAKGETITVLGVENPLKVLMWCPFISPGGGTHLLESLVWGLANHPKINLIRLALPAPTKEWEQLHLPETSKVEIRHIRSFHKVKRIGGIRGTGRFYSLLHNGTFSINTDSLNNKLLSQLALDCDLIYIFWPHRIQLPHVERPIVCTIQDVTMLDFPEILGWKTTEAERLNMRTWLAKATEVVVSSEAMHQSLIRLFPEERRPVKMIRHAVLPRSYASTSKLARLEGLPDKYLVCSGSLLPHKNLDLLLIAFSRFAHKADMPLVITGAGTELLNDIPTRDTTVREDAMLGLVQRLGSRSKLDIFGLGYVPDDAMHRLIQNATALVAPTLSEGGGSYPIEEALAAGVPVLCSDLPVLREQLAARTAKIGWFDPLSVDSIQNALDNLFADYETYKTKALLGMNDPRPSWMDVADLYIDAFHAALHNDQGVQPNVDLGSS